MEKNALKIAIDRSQKCNLANRKLFNVSGRKKKRTGLVQSKHVRSVMQRSA